MTPEQPKRSGRGGARPGSGAKPLPPGQKKKTYAAKLTPEVIAFLRSNENAAVFIDSTIRRSAAFRLWIKNNLQIV